MSKTPYVDDAVDLYTGDCVTFGDGVSIVGTGKLVIGDYTKVHRNTLIICMSDVSIGHNCWIGERSVLDGTGGLDIGNNVGVGMGSSIFTHVSFGDTFSGCNLRSSKRVTIADEAWLVGQVMVQACDIAGRVVIMPMSNVTQNITTRNSVWSGDPASDQTLRYGVPWRETGVEFRRKRFNVLLRAYARENKTDMGWAQCVDVLPTQQDAQVTYFSMSDRQYTKRGTERERDLMRWLLRHNKAKFTPEETCAH